MKFFTRKAMVLSMAAISGSALAVEVDFSISPDSERHPISPLIYGTNHRMYMTGDENFGFYRIGGNRLSAYNWENNWSNAGSDWRHQSDGYMIPEEVDGSEPAITFTHFQDNDVKSSARSMISLQMAGYVAADNDGPVSEDEVAPSPRWVPVYPEKDAPFTLDPDLNDNAVYIDELVNLLVTRYGTASEGGILGYSLDNEPGLWSHTHARIHPEKTSAQEIIDRSVETSSAVKDVDPSAKIFGPALYGFAAYNDFQGAPDWESGLSSQYAWFIDYYLDQMKVASDGQGERLLDVLDVHWYSEAKGDQRITADNAISRNDQIARLQAPRTLWDPEYLEDSWIATWFSDDLPLIPNLRDSIETYNPGTELAFTEYNFGANGHISGGVALADVLGIFGKYDVYAANLWRLGEDSTYTSLAYKLFRNYDGANSTFGDVSVEASMSDKENSSVYASIDENTGDLHVVVINKNLDEPLDGNFQLGTTVSSYDSGTVYLMTENNPNNIQSDGTVTVSDNSFNYTLPPLSASHIVLPRGSSSSSSSSFSSSSSSSVSVSSSISSSSSSLSSSSLSSSSSSTSSSDGTQGSCDYEVVNDWGSGAQAAIRITNDGSSTISGWSVSWGYSDGTTLAGSWNADVSGSNPYTAGDVGWNATIQPGQTIEFGMTVHNGASEAEAPEVSGTVCN